jgi:hypothetical protein
MAQNGTGFQWTHKREQAAILLAEDMLSDEQIADRISCGRRTLARWKDHPIFQERVRANIDTFRAAVLTEGVADRINRVQRLDRDWKRLQEVIRERSQKTLEDAIGGNTGLIVRRERPSKYGAIIEYEVDTGLLAEVRAIEMQAAKELGQWTERADVTVKDDSVLESLERKLVGLAAAREAASVSEVTDDHGSGGAGT